MMVEITWVLLLVTALSSDNFIVEDFGGYDTMSECYVASTKIFWENMPINKEALCIRVEEHSLAKD
jgi:hypothetical protein